MSLESLPDSVINYFPYHDLRPFQDRFIKTVYTSLSKGSHVVIEGCNGLGKTVAVLSATLPYVKEKKLSIIYCCRTHKQADRVIEELKIISKKHQVTGLSLRGRKEMCLNPLLNKSSIDSKVMMDACRTLKEQGKCVYYENIRKDLKHCFAVQRQLLSRPILASEIRDVCKKEVFCPYELSKFLINSVDVISTNYVYLFNSDVRHSFLQGYNKSLSRVVLVLDEAHNLPELATEFAGDSLTSSSISYAYNEAKKNDCKRIADFCRRFEKITKSLSELAEEELYIPPVIFVDILKKETQIDDILSFLDYMHSLSEQISYRLLSEGKYPRSYMHKFCTFLLKWIATSRRESYFHVLSKYSAKGSLSSSKLEIIALDPRELTRDILSSVYCSISISGTLEPMSAYVLLTGLPNITKCDALPSPFPDENILCAVSLGVTTCFDHRTLEMYNKIARRVAEVVHATPTNIGVFVTSYDLLKGLLDIGFSKLIDKPLFCEKSIVSSRENDSLISHFKSQARKGGGVLLGVQGGRNSEGVDYPGDQMDSVVIVGVPYARPTSRIAAKLRYYESQFPGHGYEYSYIIPALRKSSQTAGRPVRSLNDRSAIIFLDYRIATSYCKKYLPLWIRKNLKTLPDKDGVLFENVSRFFNQ